MSRPENTGHFPVFNLLKVRASRKTRVFQDRKRHNKSTDSVVTKGIKDNVRANELSGKKKKIINLFNLLLKEHKLLTASHVRSWPRNDLIMTWGSNKDTGITSTI